MSCVNFTSVTLIRRVWSYRFYVDCIAIPKIELGRSNDQEDTILILRHATSENNVRSEKMFHLWDHSQLMSAEHFDFDMFHPSESPLERKCPLDNATKTKMSRLFLKISRPPPPPAEKMNTFVPPSFV